MPAWRATAVAPSVTRLRHDTVGSRQTTECAAGSAAPARSPVARRRQLAAIASAPASGAAEPGEVIGEVAVSAGEAMDSGTDSSVTDLASGLDFRSLDGDGAGDGAD